MLHCLVTCCAWGLGAAWLQARYGMEDGLVCFQTSRSIHYCENRPDFTAGLFWEFQVTPTEPKSRYNYIIINLNTHSNRLSCWSPIASVRFWLCATRFPSWAQMETPVLISPLQYSMSACGLIQNRPGIIMVFAGRSSRLWSQANVNTALLCALPLVATRCKLRAVKSECDESVEHINCRCSVL